MQGCILSEIHRSGRTGEPDVPPVAGLSAVMPNRREHISTNAGGVSAVRYGITRDLVLGLEVVLPDGQILSNLSPLRKDNRGYALHQLLIGAEGSLGIVTGASLRLFLPPVNRVTAFLAISGISDLMPLLAKGPAVLWRSSHVVRIHLWMLPSTCSSPASLSCGGRFKPRPSTMFSSKPQRPLLFWRWTRPLKPSLRKGCLRR